MSGDEKWDDRAFEPVLRGFQKRFAETNTEEGDIMATVLAYAISETYASRRGAILAEFRTSEKLLRLFDQAVAQRDATPHRAGRPAGRAGSVAADRLRTESHLEYIHYNCRRFAVALTLGTRLGPYEIAAQIGKGGMGEVDRTSPIQRRAPDPDAVAAAAAGGRYALPYDVGVHPTGSGSC